MIKLPSVFHGLYVKKDELLEPVDKIETFNDLELRLNVESDNVSRSDLNPVGWFARIRNLFKNLTDFIISTRLNMCKRSVIQDVVGSTLSKDDSFSCVVNIDSPSVFS